MRFLLLSLACLCLATAQISLPLRRSAAKTPLLRAYASTPVANEYNVSLRKILYTVDIGIGNPTQDFTLWLVSSSAVKTMQWTWVYSSSNTDSPPDANKFNTTGSSTYHSGEDSYQISIGEGSGTGVLSQDDITLGGVTATQAFFLLVSSIEGEAEIFSDGILGLGFNALSDGHLTIIEQLKATGVIPNALFSLYLSSDDVSQSTLVLGDIDLGKYAVAGETLSYVSVYGESGLWLSQLNSVSVGDVEVSTDATPVLFEFGVGVIVGPAEAVSQALAEISANQDCFLADEEFLVCTCDDANPIENYPTLAFTFHGQAQSFTVRPQTYFFKEGDNCVALLVGIQENVWILGDSFLREYYTVYDVENSRIGLVRSVDVVTASGFGYMPLFWVGLVGVALGTLYYKQNRKGKKDGNYYLLVDLKEGLIR